eukprot:SAG31_NODE_42575_length_271_cov_0.587209_1_plen_80_part_10
MAPHAAVPEKQSLDALALIGPRGDRRGARSIADLAAASRHLHQTAGSLCLTLRSPQQPLCESLFVYHQIKRDEWISILD